MSRASGGGGVTLSRSRSLLRIWSTDHESTTSDSPWLRHCHSESPDDDDDDDPFPAPAFIAAWCHPPPPPPPSSSSPSLPPSNAWEEEGSADPPRAPSLRRRGAAFRRRPGEEGIAASRLVGQIWGLNWSRF